MYPRIPWELVADPLESAERNLGTTRFGISSQQFCNTFATPKGSRHTVWEPLV